MPHDRRDHDEGLPTAKAVIYASELDYAARTMVDWPALETGGDLFGFWTHTGQPVVQHVIGPGPRARHEGAAFFQDRAFLVDAGRRLNDAHALQHIGEWHSHHRLGLPRPSGGDVATVRRAMRDRGLKRFLLVIGAFEGAAWGRTGTPMLRAYLFRKEAPDREDPCGWVVLPGVSPFRAGHAVPDGLRPYPPRTRAVAWRAEPRVALGDDLAASERPVLPGGSWLSRPEGVAVLRRIHGRVAAEHGAARLRRLDDGRVSLSFAADEVAFEVAFPDRFPHEPPSLSYRLPGAGAWDDLDPATFAEPEVVASFGAAAFAFLDVGVPRVLAAARPTAREDEPAPDDELPVAPAPERPLDRAKALDAYRRHAAPDSGPPADPDPDPPQGAHDGLDA